MQRGNNTNEVAARLLRIDLDYVADSIQTDCCSPEIVSALLQKRQELQRYAHYYSRFEAHGQGQVFSQNQSLCLVDRAKDFNKVSEWRSGADTDFFQMANQRLVASRRMLKYTYCFLYYKLAPNNRDEESDSSVSCDNGFQDNDCPDDGAMSSSLSTSLALFLDHQERLERMTEQLSFLSENALTRTDRKRVVDVVSASFGSYVLCC